MSSRERIMAIILIVLILLFGSVAVGYAFVYQPIQAKNKSADALDVEIKKKQEEYDKLKAEKQRLEEIKHRSLPPDHAIAKREYSEMMSRLLLQAKVPAGGFHIHELPTPDNTGTPALAAKKSAYTKVAFEIDFERVDMWAVHDFLLAYYKLDLLHQITKFEIKTDSSQPASANRGKPANDRKDLVVKIVTEAIILDGAAPRRTLLAVPAAFAAVGGLPGYNALLLTPESSRGLSPIQFSPVLATKSRDYTLIVQNDIFHGPLPLPPAMSVEKIADISTELDKPIAPVKVRLAGDLGPAGKVTLSAKAETGTILPEGSIEVNQAERTILFTPVKGEIGKSKVRVAALTDDGKKAEITFNVEIKEPVANEAAKLPDISDAIRLIIAVPASDGSATAIVRDNFNPHTYEIEVSPSGRVKVTKFFYVAANKKKDRDYEDPGLLILSDDLSSTKRTFKVVAIDYEGLILAELKPEKSAEKPKGPMFPGRPMDPADPLALVAGTAATIVKSAAEPTLYRWSCGLSLKVLKELSKDEAKKIQLKIAASAPPGATVTGN